MLERPRIHSNLIVPSTLHHCLKFMDTQGVVKTIYAERQPFKGIENYFTYVFQYKDEQENETNDGNEYDVELDNGS